MRQNFVNNQKIKEVSFINQKNKNKNNKTIGNDNCMYRPCYFVHYVDDDDDDDFVVMLLLFTIMKNNDRHYRNFFFHSFLSC